MFKSRFKGKPSPWRRMVPSGEFGVLKCFCPPPPQGLRASASVPHLVRSFYLGRRYQFLPEAEGKNKTRFLFAGSCLPSSENQRAAWPPAANRPRARELPAQAVHQASEALEAHTYLGPGEKRCRQPVTSTVRKIEPPIVFTGQRFRCLFAVT